MNEALLAVADAVISETTRLQNLASGPNRSVWVSANAGSGKTHVLTQRVIRLMLAGTRPSAILCLTYTKAAASEMSNRVFERLSHWTSLDDDALSTEIAAMEGEVPSRLKLSEARKLFARALETPGGLKIQTIHAFCEALLHQFPLEANVAGHFSVLDDKAAASLLSEARRNLLSATQAEQNDSLAKAFHEVLGTADESGLDRLLGDIIRQRSAIGRFFDYAARKGGYRETLASLLGIPPGADLEDIASKAWPLPEVNSGAILDYVALANSKGGVKTQETAYRLGLANREEDPLKRLELLRLAFLTLSETPYADVSIFSAAMRKADANLCEAIGNCRTFIHDLWMEYKTFRMFELTVSALTLAEHLIAGYETLKKERGFLDFEDFISRTEALLKKEGIGPWVHYKLDQGIDHILVDEAQDTSPAQWEIIRSLTDEFFSGESARIINRTIFAVGDEKQSIYSFQGARPERFANERRVNAARAEAGGREFLPVNLRLSFRSTEDVLSAVDQVFDNPDNARGLSADNEPVAHVSHRLGHPGSVDIWETIAEESTDEDDEDWLAPFDRLPERSAASELAKRMAAAIHELVGKHAIVTRKGVRSIRPGDILVLVRKRDAFAAALSRELKKAGRVPVAGTDRLVLASHIAIQDLMALGKLALLAEDDLSLAALIKSPLLDLDEDALFEICRPRENGESVWQRLSGLAIEHQKWRDVHATLQRWRMLARQHRVHDFYALLLGRDGGRRKFLARFGSEVSDVLDEFLNFALDHEQAGLPGLASFIATLERDSPEIKREQDKGREEVRIMTVHASKGLEAPVVFLVDGGGKPFDKNLLPKLRLIENDRLPLALPVWCPSKEFQNPAIHTDDLRLEAAAEEEYRRLLYVGMTRASDRLILCSYRKKREIDGTWAKITAGSLAADGERCQPATFRAGGLEWQGMKWRHNAESAAEPVDAIGEEQEPKATLPGALFSPLPPPVPLPRPLAPSGVHVVIDEEDGDRIVGSVLFAEHPKAAMAQIRGKIIHRLLQSLTVFPAAERRAAADRYLLRSVPRWPEQDRRALAESVLGILADPEFAGLHAQGSEAEVSIMGTIRLGERSHAVSGRIDRMGVSGNEVFILDYKTNLVAPAAREAIPFAHRAQLALYREVLKPIYPGKDIHCLLLYTEGPDLYSLTDVELEKALLALSGK
ncbi:double-strand break repair helicase AddA [Rhizobium sp. KVB221]|uniref:DNA 3'-5' helicase n=1 Tax=Rhizobium setariae TaxID=2801340 RepID=A0A936YSR4_9HYPH|nr:double-strand break repair helicase AddA [Rhizobium setariae]MBL0374177.1 double-strand break repair helicase AddA [Rhizobium setariae]